MLSPEFYTRQDMLAQQSSSLSVFRSVSVRYKIFVGAVARFFVASYGRRIIDFARYRVTFTLCMSKGGAPLENPQRNQMIRFHGTGSGFLGREDVGNSGLAPRRIIRV